MITSLLSFILWSVDANYSGLSETKMKNKYKINNDEELMSYYKNTMIEIKRRNKAIYDALNGFDPGQPKIILAEFCYLQIRFICELIALGCLVIHGDLKNINKKINKEWHAGDLIKKLEKLHPEFYPFPTKLILNSKGRPERWEDITDGFFSKKDLIKTYGMLGNRLHRGNLKNLILGKNYEVSLDEIHEIATNIRNLLSHHNIRMMNPDFMIVTSMETGEDGDVEVHHFQKKVSTTIE